MGRKNLSQADTISIAPHLLDKKHGQRVNQ